MNPKPWKNLVSEDFFILMILSPDLPLYLRMSLMNIVVIVADMTFQGIACKLLLFSWYNWYLASDIGGGSTPVQQYISRAVHQYKLPLSWPLAPYCPRLKQSSPHVVPLAKHLPELIIFKPSTTCKKTNCITRLSSIVSQPKKVVFVFVCVVVLIVVVAFVVVVIVGLT